MKFLCEMNNVAKFYLANFCYYLLPESVVSISHRVMFIQIPSSKYDLFEEYRRCILSRLKGKNVLKKVELRVCRSYFIFERE